MPLAADRRMPSALRGDEPAHGAEVAAAAFTAAWIPAWRASGIDPVTALRD